MTAMTLACLAKEREVLMSLQKALASLHYEYNTILTTHVQQRYIKNYTGTENGQTADQSPLRKRGPKPMSSSA